MLTSILSLGTGCSIFLLIAVGYTIQAPTICCFSFVIVNHHHNKHHQHQHHHQLSLLSLSSIKTTGSESESESTTTTTTTTETTIIDDDDDDDDDEQSKKKIPIHLLAGFLGSGKTTTLKHVLENMDHGLKIGIIVNDIASVNIDAKFILSSSSTSSNDKEKDDGITTTTTTTTASNDSIINDDIVELQNGCACCSLAGELFDSIESLLLRTSNSSPTTGSRTSDSSSPRSTMYDAIIVELSGVADPIAIQNNWRDRARAVINDNNKDTLLVTNKTEIGNIITVVDATTFSSDYMTFDILKDRKEWYAAPTATTAIKPKLPHSVNRQVVELLAEQIEAASIVIVNKQDIASKNEVLIAMELIKSLNKDANIIATSNGKIDVQKITQNVLGVQVLPTSLDNDDDDDDNDDNNNDEHSHSHHDHDATTCDNDDNDDDDDNCTDPSHSHPHDDHVTDTTTTCEDTDCTDPSHSHSHDDHTSTTTCDDTDCTDPSHSHNHSSSSTCEDTNCTDPSHTHSHEHDHSSSSSTSMTSTTNLGISNFVYKASKPFNANRLMKLIWSWPIPIKDELDFITFDFKHGNEDADAEKDEDEDKSSLAKIGYGLDNNDDDDSTTTTTATATATTNVSPFIGVLRSKGFCWIAPTAWDGLLDDSWRHDKAMYWSHAGKHMGIQMGGNFWASISEITMKEFFSNKPNEYKRILKDDFITDEFGDRRQEIVFIGIQLLENDISTALNDCLLTDNEMIVYRSELLKREMKMIPTTTTTATIQK